MGIFTLLEEIDGAFTRFYARRKVWVWGVLALPVVFVFGWLVWVAVWAPPMGGAALIAHSKIDRPIRGFSVNGVAGPNTGAYNPNNPSSGVGVNSTCCGVIKGKIAEVIWTVDYTRAQYNAGLRTEVHKITMPLPERKRGENDLHVYFLPGDKVLLGWSDNAFSPYDPRSPNYQPAAILEGK